MADPIIRRAVAADAAAVGKVYALSWQAGYAGILPEDFLAGLTPENCAPDPEKLARSNTLVAEAGEIGGLLSFGPGRDGGESGLREIYTCYVLPDFWRQGLGRRLMAEALVQLQKQDCPGVFLWVLRDNPRARRFYESMGFSPTGQAREIQVAGAAAAEVQYARKWR